jgi:desulfoferrodoxin-like iron-binding protein
MFCFFFQIGFSNLQLEVKRGKRMTNIGELYVCKICGNTVKCVAAGAGRLVCCGQEMEFIGNIEDEKESS